MYPIDLAGKKAAVFGVANHRSLAFHIAKILAEAGADLAFSYQGDRIKNSVEKITADFDGAFLFECDVTRKDHLDNAFGLMADKWGKIDYLVHSIAFAQREDLEGDFSATSRDGFRTALEVSAYSLIAMTRRAVPLMKNGGSIISLSYLAAERAVPNYNVMGTAKAALEQITRQLAYEFGPKNIRVNAVSAGPVNTLSARGISGFTEILKQYSEKAPLGRNIEQEEVAKAALFLLCDMSSGITGNVLHVDGGFSIMGI